MGVVTVPRESVQEWLLPQPFTASGEASVSFSGVADSTVVVLCSAAVVVAGNAATVVICGFCDALVAPFGSVFILPVLAAEADVAFDNTVSVDDAISTAAIAYAQIASDCSVSVSGVCVAGVLLVTSAPALVAVDGSAEVSFGYFGDGDYPIFPFKLPLLFVDDPQNVQDASVYVSLFGDGLLDYVFGFAPAELIFDGGAVLTRQGSTPIFPFALPLVFDEPANVRLGSAALTFDMGFGCVVDVIGESAVTVDGDGVSYGSAVFPWAFPVALAA